MLSIQHLHAFYGDKEVLKDLSLEVDDGKIMAIVGASGSGKSTLLKAVMGLAPDLRITGGSVLFRGRPLPEGKALRSLCGREIAMVFQNASQAMDPLKTVGHLFYETVHIHDPKAARKDINARAKTLMDELGLKDAIRLMKSYPSELSGGMNQRIAIAAALMNHPQLLLADEPTSALDVVGTATVVELLEKLRRSGNMTMVLVTHNMGVAARLADKIAVMLDGHIVECDCREHILTKPKHPYTRSLLKAVPQIKTEGAIPDGIT